MPTCAQITDAINVLAEAATPSNPNSIVDITNLVSPLLFPTGDETPNNATVQFISGGNAVLSVPSDKSVDGKVFKMTVSGYVTSANPQIANSYFLGIYFGNSTAGVEFTGISGNMDNSGLHSNFSFTWYFFWDSISQKLSNTPSFTGQFSNPTGGQNLGIVTSQSSLEFILDGNSNGHDGSGNPIDPQNTVTLTQFKLDLV